MQSRESAHHEVVEAAAAAASYSDDETAPGVRAACIGWLRPEQSSSSWRAAGYWMAGGRLVGCRCGGSQRESERASLAGLQIEFSLSGYGHVGR
jgi:hypothetical protein